MNNHKLENWETRDFIYVIKFLQNKFGGGMRSYYMCSDDNAR